MDRVQVLIFVDSFRIGGSERQAVELLKSLDRRRFDPLVACFHKDGPLLAEVPSDVPLIAEFPLSGFSNVKTIRHALRFVLLLRRMRIQVVQCFDFYSNIFAVPLSRLARVPVVLASRRDEGLSMRNKVQHRVELSCFRLASGIVTNSEAIKVQLENRDHIHKPPIWTIHNGIDLDRFDCEKMLGNGMAGSKSQRTTIAVIANLRPEKGHLIMLESLRCLLRRISTVELLLVGEGPMRAAIEDRIKELGLSDHVRLAGMIRNVPSVLKNVDIVASSSISEAFPNAILEAMAAALPVVATDVGGNRELIVDGRTGYLVPPNKPFEFAQQLEKLCSSSKERYRLGNAGRQIIAELYTVNRMAKRFETLFDTLLN